MRHLLATTLLIACGLGAAAIADGRREDKSREFTYAVPDDWKVVNVQNAPHDVLVLRVGDGRNRNIVINNQTGSSPLTALKQEYERDLPKRHRDFQLISSDLIELSEKRQAIRIVHVNTTLSVPLRQLNYILEVGGRRYVVVCTAVKEDDAKYDKIFETFVNSIAASDKSSPTK
jgi:hypothetical protein